MKLFGLRAVFFAAAVLAALPSMAKAAPGDAVDDRVRDRINALSPGIDMPYVLTELDATADNFWKDFNGPSTLNQIRLVTADTTAATTTTAQSVGYYDGSQFKQLFVAGTDGIGAAVTYVPGGNINVTGINAPSPAANTVDYLGTSSTLQWNTLPTDHFEFGVLTDRAITTGNTNTGSSITMSDPFLSALGSNSSGGLQYRAYRLVSDGGPPPQPGTSEASNAYVIAFYNFNGGLTSIGNTYVDASSTGGLIAFIVNGVVNPEPGSMALLATGLVGVIGYRIRRKRGQVASEPTIA